MRRPTSKKVAEPWDLYKAGFTCGTLQAFLSCREKCKLKVIDRLSKVGTSSALFYGSLVHGVLEHHYRSAGKPYNDETVMKMIDEVALVLEKEVGGIGQDFESEIAMARSIVPHYFRHWSPNDTKFKWIDVEHKFCIPVKMPSGKTANLRGMVDGVFTINGKVWLLETKTASRVDEQSLIDRLPFDLQVGIYSWAVNQAIGKYPYGVLYNVVRKPELRQGAKENFSTFWQRVSDDVRKRPEWYFMRWEIRRTKAEQDRWHNEFIAMITDFENWAGGIGRYKNSESCQTRYGNCEFLPICSRNDTSHFQVRDLQFPELDS